MTIEQVKAIIKGEIAKYECSRDKWEEKAKALVRGSPEQAIARGVMEAYQNKALGLKDLLSIINETEAR